MKFPVFVFTKDHPLPTIKCTENLKPRSQTISSPRVEIIQRRDKIKKTTKTDRPIILRFIKSILKSLVILVMCFFLSGAIYSRIALSFALNRIFFSANENGTVKQNNQSDFKAFLNSPITLQENKRQKRHRLANLATWFNKYWS